MIWKGKALKLWSIHFHVLRTIYIKPSAAQLPFGLSCSCNSILCLGLEMEKTCEVNLSIPWATRDCSPSHNKSLCPLPSSLLLTHSEGAAILCSRRLPHTLRVCLDPRPLFLAHHCLTSSIYLLSTLHLWFWGWGGSGRQKSFTSFLCHRHNLGLHNFSPVLPSLSTNCISGDAWLLHR